MHSVPKKIFQILDGTPAVYGQYSRGQSLVERALVTPLLIVLLMGLAEIGWFANNYLILLETTRVGARLGAIQTGNTSPLLWPNGASLLPALQPDAPSSLIAQSYRKCPIEQKSLQRFYNTVICPMLRSMLPLDFRANDPSLPASPTNGNGVDDIVVSGFALQSFNPSDPNIPAAMRAVGVIDTVTGLATNQQQVVVVGRYPTNANECTNDTATDKDLRDPFNYINYTGVGNTLNGWRNYIVPSGADVDINRLYYELDGYDNPASERQRGFALTGQHVIFSTRALPAASQCYGSEWTMDRVEKLMNVTNFSLSGQAQRSGIPSQGLILVEMFWQHSLLLRNPVFNPVFNILNDPNNPNGGGAVISVWAAFPLPTIDPRIKYALGS